MPMPLVVKFMKSICQVGPNLSGSRSRALIFCPKEGFWNAGGAFADQFAPAPDEQQQRCQHGGRCADVDDHVGDGFERRDHAPHAQVEHDGAQDHQRHGDLVQDALEVQPAADDERDHDGDQRQHDVQVADDRILHGGLFGVADDILGQEDLKAVAEEGAGDGAEQGRNHRGDGRGEEGHTFQVHALFGAGVVLIG